MTNISVLIVEDDLDISNMLKDLLGQNGYHSNVAYSGTEALLCLEKKQYDLILLDLMLPGIDGEDVLHNLRKKINTPVIAVSARDDINSKINLLKGGADDYVTKPFNIDELLARIEALLRRNKTTGNELNDTLTFKDIMLNRTTFEVTVNNVPIKLTKREYLILQLLMSNPQKVFTKNNIYESVWHEELLGDDNSVNVHISNIRAKLANVNPDNDYIQTVWGIGFKMSAIKSN